MSTTTDLGRPASHPFTGTSIVCVLCGCAASSDAHLCMELNHQSPGARGASECRKPLPCVDHPRAVAPLVRRGIDFAAGRATSARPTRDQVMLTIAGMTAKLSTCYRRRVGCVLTDARGRVLATGYNGVASKMPHCNEPGGGGVLFPHRCPGATSPSGTNLDACLAIHAEQNALVQCGAPWEIETCYVTASPCVSCVKLLLNTSCRRIVFLDAYPQPEAEKLWFFAGQGRAWEQGTALVKL